jgi:hypothetical protein
MRRLYFVTSQSVYCVGRERSARCSSSTPRVGAHKSYSSLECTFGGPCSVVGIATVYGLDGPGIESRWGPDFPHESRPALRPIQPPVKCVPLLFRG